MPRTPNLGGVSVFLSTSNLTNLTLPTYFCAMSSRIGASALHGPHHCAQKSTRTGTLELTTSDSKTSSEICCTWLLIVVETPRDWLTMQFQRNLPYFASGISGGSFTYNNNPPPTRKNNTIVAITARWLPKYRVTVPNNQGPIKAV